MANLYFNNLTITARRTVLDEIRGYVNADTLWAANPQLDPSDVIDDGHQILYRYETKGGRSMEMIETLVQRFPEAHVLLTFRNDNEAISGFMAYADGEEVAAQVFEQ